MSHIEQLEQPAERATVRVRAIRVPWQVLWYLLAGLIIYLGLWRTDPRYIPANTYDESQWLSHSVCLEAVLRADYAEICREINLQGVDHSAGAKYLLGLLRWSNGIPAEAVKRLYTHPEPLDPAVRVEMIGGITALSSVALFLLFAGLRQAYGGGSALAVLVLLVLTPFWQSTLRTIMAEPPLFFFTVLVWLALLWLVHLLTQTPAAPLWLLIVAAAALGTALGWAVGVKPNSIVLVAGLGAALIPFGRNLLRHWFLLLWLIAVVVLSATAALLINYPLLWNGDVVAGLQAALAFRSKVLAYQSLFFPDYYLVDAAAALRTGLSMSFSPPQFMVLPAWLSVPLCLLGIWAGLRHPNLLARASHWFLLTSGLFNALIVPFSWGRYFLFTFLAVAVFTAVGFTSLVTAVRQRAWAGRPGPQAVQSELPARSFGRVARLSAVASIGLAVIIPGLVIITGLQAAPKTNLWWELGLAEHDADLATQIAVVNQLAAHNPQLRDTTGAPLLWLLERYFVQNKHLTDPAIIAGLNQSAQLLVQHATDPDLAARVEHDRAQLGASFNRVHLAPLETNVPADWVPADAPGDYLFTGDHYLRTTVAVPVDGQYQLAVDSLHQAPAPILLGLSINGADPLTLRYDRADNSRALQTVVADLTTGRHTLELRLLNDGVVDGVDRNAVIHGLTVTPLAPSGMALSAVCPQPAPTAVADDPRVLRAASCAAMQTPVALDRRYDRLQIAVTAPLPALYDIALTLQPQALQPQSIELRLADLPLGRVPLPVAGQPLVLNSARNAGDQGGEWQLPPVYLPPGEHLFEIARDPDAPPWRAGAQIAIGQLQLIPRYPDRQTFTPAELGSSTPQALRLTSDTEISGAWQQYIHGYSFYQVQLSGISSTATEFPLEVTIDDQVIGIVTLHQDGRRPDPLLVELANGLPHRFALRPLGPAAADHALLYAVEIFPASQSLLIAGSNLRWSSADNDLVTVRGGMVAFPATTELRKRLSLAAGQYNVSFRTRRSAGAPPAQLQFRIGGWPLCNVAVPGDGNWHTVRCPVPIDLPGGEHEIGLTWQGGRPELALEILYVQIESQASE